MVMCEMCKQQPSTLHLTEITHGVKKELHLCARCAQAQGVTFQSHFSLPDFLGDLSSNLPRPPGKKKPSSASCPTCGITYAQFRAAGRLGCPEDYVLFRKMLLPFVARIHGAVQHAGKVPSRRPDVAHPAESAHKLADLHKALADAIKRENYEEAAKIRDEISKLEEKLPTE